MKNNYEKLITVKAYAESLVYNPLEESELIRVEDYIASIRTQAAKAQTSSYITVKDYVEELKQISA